MTAAAPAQFDLARLEDIPPAATPPALELVQPIPEIERAGIHAVIERLLERSPMEPDEEERTQGVVRMSFLISQGLIAVIQETSGNVIELIPIVEGMTSVYGKTEYTVGGEVDDAFKATLVKFEAAFK